MLNITKSIGKRVGVVLRPHSSIPKQFPQEHFVPLANDEHRLGRIVINKNHDGMSAEIDIVLKDGFKIWCAVDRLYKIEDHIEALDLAVQRLSEFLRNKK
jgi:hypothetical protein